MAHPMFNDPPVPTEGSIDRDIAAAEPAFMEIEVRLPAAKVQKVEAAAGFSAMELIRAAGVPIKAECGGAGVCATCHCRIPSDWSDRLPEPTAEELFKLDEIPSADERSRLSCQIQMTDDLDGLVLELQSDSLESR